MKVVFDQNISLKFLQQENKKVSDTIQKLSSGLEINKAADNPSNLAILTSLRARIGGIEAAIQNVQDAISLYQTQDTGLGNCELKLVQMKELAVKASNEAVLRDDCLDRTRINEEVQNLKNAIQDIAINTTFNTKQVLIGDPLETLEAIDSNAIHNSELGENPTWDSDSKTVYYESERAKGSRTVADDNDIYRIWSVTDDAKNRTMVTPDPYTPADSDKDGFVDHPLSDRKDKNPDIPAGMGVPPPMRTETESSTFSTTTPGSTRQILPIRTGTAKLIFLIPIPRTEPRRRWCITTPTATAGRTTWMRIH